MEPLLTFNVAKTFKNEITHLKKVDEAQNN
jgi:hypothetical protein